MVPSTFRIARELLSRIEDSESGEMIPSLQVNIPPDRYEELYTFSKERSEQFLNRFELVEGAKYVYESPLKSVIARNWSPQMEVIGAAGFPPIQLAGNVLRP